MAGKRILVTGGCGFIGQHLVGFLRARGELVRVLDLDPVDLGEEVEVVRGSILDADHLMHIMKGMDHVYHLAANPNLWALKRSDFYRINTEGTRIVLETANRLQVRRLIYTSTESIIRGLAHNANGDGLPIDERMSVSMADIPGAYCRSKFLAENLAINAAKSGLPVVIVNPTMPIGPGDRRLTPPTRMLLGFLRSEYPAYLDCAFNMIDVRDAALGHILAAEYGIVGERYILGGENIRLREVLSILAELTGRAMPRWRVPYWVAYISALIGEIVAVTVTERPPRAPLTGVRLARSPMFFDSTKTAQELGLTTRQIRESLRDAITWLEMMGYLPRALSSMDAPLIASGFDD
jgi:dihydroflavonol-4-reductase